MHSAGDWGKTSQTDPGGQLSLWRAGKPRVKGTLTQMLRGGLPVKAGKYHTIKKKALKSQDPWPKNTTPFVRKFAYCVPNSEA